MSTHTREPKYADFSPPTTENQADKQIGMALQQVSLVAAAASATAPLWVADYDGELIDAFVAIGTLPAAGESMVFDIQKNGASILTATLTINNATTAKVNDLYSLIDATKRGFVKGDYFTVVRTYAAGGGPAPMANTSVVLRPGMSFARY